MGSIALSNHLDADFKAEVVAAELIESGAQEDHIIIQMVGPQMRTYTRDVYFIEEQFSEREHTNYTLIRTPKEGIYDMLPEGLFHPAGQHQSLVTQREILEIIKLHRLQEENARKFFLPFEAAINYLRVEMAVYENKLDKKSHYGEFAQVFAANWDIFNYLDNAQASIFAQLLPIINDIRDHYPVIETVFKLILMLPVSITSVRRKPMLLDEPMVTTLDGAALGVDTTTGNVAFDDGDNEIIIKIGPMDKKQLGQFVPGSNQMKIFETLCDHFLPVHLDVTTSFELQESDKEFVLADEENPYNSTLGLSTYL